MTEIVICKCILRVTRHGGWSWGVDRHGLLECVTSLLPDLIAARLAELLGDADGEIIEPVRVRVALGAGRLPGVTGLQEAIATAMTPDILPVPRRAVSRQPGMTQSPAVASGAPTQPLFEQAHDNSAERGAPGPRALLLRWRAQGDLLQRLRGFSAVTLQAWLAALLEESQAPAEIEGSYETLLAEARMIRLRLPPYGSSRTDAARARLIIMVELAAHHPRLPLLADTSRLLDQVAPWPEAGAQSEKDSPEASSGTAPMRRGGDAATLDVMVPRAALQPRSAPTALPVGQDIKLCSVLPFLVLGILQRIGWLELASATFRALALPDRGGVFAAALACKLLPPPERGWYRPGPVLGTAATFAGLQAPPSPTEFRSWCRDAAGGLSALDAFVATELANGHLAELPLLITPLEGAHGAGWLLFDADGFLPIAWAFDEASVLSALTSFGPSVVLVSARAASPVLMRGLVAARRAFATDARPARGEDWRRLPGRPGAWGFLGDMALPRLAAAAQLRPELETAAIAISRELLDRRPCVAPGEGLDLERSAFLAAATGLGLLSWTLWRDREPVDPLLALDRLGDLDGSARVTDTAIEVRPAVGRRYLDIRDHKLLADIPAVPWLGCRAITFIGP
jgi:hypothetical protein